MSIAHVHHEHQASHLCHSQDVDVVLLGPGHHLAEAGHGKDIVHHRIVITVEEPRASPQVPQELGNLEMSRR